MKTAENITSPTVTQQCKDTDNNLSIKGFTPDCSFLIDEIRAERKELEKKTAIFPFDLLPMWLQMLSDECERAYGTPKELFSLAFLCGISAVSGKKFALKSGNYINYSQLWLMIVGKSGSGKSEPFRLAMKPIIKSDSDSYQSYLQELESWKANDEAGQKPVWEQSLINDTTPEALYRALAHSHNGLTLYRDELSGWFSDIGRYSKSGEIGHYLSIYDNVNFSVNRKSDEPILVQRPFLNIIGTIQPSVLSKVLSRNDAEDSGFAQRFLFYYPDFPKRTYNLITHNHAPNFQTYNKFIADLALMNDETFTLSKDAEGMYALHFNEMEDLRVNAPDFWASVYSKAQIQTLRLALTIRVARLMSDYGNIIDLDDMQCAIEMQQLFISHLQKFKGETATGNGINKTDLIKYLRNENPALSQTDLAKIFDVSQPYINKVLNR